MRILLLELRLMLAEDLQITEEEVINIPCIVAQDATPVTGRVNTSEDKLTGSDRMSGLNKNIVEIEFVQLRTCQRCKSDLLDESDKQVECDTCGTLSDEDIPEYVQDTDIVDGKSNKKLKYSQATTIKLILETDGKTYGIERV
ncbi:hypothetical protein ACHWQZ_G002558 [Mnemiopsis leidyi]